MNFDDAGEGGRRQASLRGGPRPIPLTFNTHAVDFIGIDIRREKITAAMIDLGGALQKVLITVASENWATSSLTSTGRDASAGAADVSSNTRPAAFW